MGFLVRILGFCLAELLFLSIEVDAADVVHGNGCSDDAHHAQRIGTGIS